MGVSPTRTGGGNPFSAKMNSAENETAGMRTGDTTALDKSSNDTIAMTKLDADYRELDEADPLQCLVNDPFEQNVSHGMDDVQQSHRCSVAGRSWMTYAFKAQALKSVWRPLIVC